MTSLSRLTGLSIGVGLLAGCSQSARLPAGRWVDLTHDYSEQTVYWPTAEPFKLTPEFAGRTERGYHYHANRYSASEHGGTHADAPIHFTEKGRTIDQIPVEQWVGEAVVIDVSAKASADRDYQATPADLKAWEAAHARISDGAIVLLRTGYGRHWPDLERYLGTAKRGPEAVAELHFPGLHPNAARWLVANRKIKLFGIDTASIDYGQSTLFECHQVLFGAEIPAVENVANLDQLPPKGAIVFALPMKIKGGSGAPVRIAALLP